MSNVSAIVVSYFTGPLLGRCIAALSADDAISEIILVDNGNPDGMVKRAVADVTTRVTIISGQGNIGFAAGCNAAAQKASGEYFLFLNPDALLPKDGASKMVAHSSDVDHPWLMGAKLVDPDGTEQQGSRRAVLTPWRAFVEAAKLYRVAPNHPYFKRFNEHLTPCPDEIAEVPTLSGACLFVSKDDYWSIGGMDEGYFLHVEDIDFCLRFAEAGGTVLFNPFVEIVHYKSSSRANAVRIEARKTKSMIRYFKTHFSDTYPAPFLWFLAGLLWLSFGVLFVKRAIGRALRMIGFRSRVGADAARRAKAIDARRSSR